MLKDQIILTCEHATNFIPKKYRGFFPLNKKVKGRWGNEKTKDVLNEHWGWDVGALNLAKYLSKKLNIPLHFFPVSRLLIEGNRYFLRSLFEEFTRNLPDELKKDLIETFWFPHVDGIFRKIQKTIESEKQALHLGIHSFTPVHSGKHRDCDIGILFLSKRKNSRLFGHTLQAELKKQFPNFKIRRNYPYSGDLEGLVKFFSKNYNDDEYIAIELEVNNKHLRKNNSDLYKKIFQAIDRVVAEM